MGVSVYNISTQFEYRRGAMQVVKRDGEVVQFDENKIKDAILKAANAVSVFFDANDLKNVVARAVEEISDRFGESSIVLNVENVHDIVEKHLMRQSQYSEVAKSYDLHLLFDVLTHDG
jgi:anaerobic ribonucleoside-triphosphate reductase